jgi:cyanophycinase
LVIVGGGDTPDSVQERFIALAGGSGKARIAVLPMASTQYDEEAREVTEDFEKLGAEVQVLNLNRHEAQNDATAKVLEAFDGYWFTGGDQSRLSSVLAGTSALDIVVRRYHEGAAIGGTSAGAAVMSSVMLTGRWRQPKDADEAELLNVARGMMEVSEGFGFFKGAIVDQHFMKRARYNRLLSVILDHPQLIGVGIDEETALLVRPDGVWEVLGNHYVKVFDARRARIIGDEDSMAKASDIRMHVLPAGSTFNAKTRKVTFPGD